MSPAREIIMHISCFRNRPAFRLPEILVTKFPGIALCASTALLAFEAEKIERAFLQKSWLEMLNLALVIGICLRMVSSRSRVFDPGIRFCSKSLLDVAIVLLGTGFSMTGIVSAGPGILVCVFGIVAFSLALTILIGRLTGLSHSQTLLVACGNSICGNSAIMAVAPVIHAREEDIGAALAFTATGGLAIVLGLPLLLPFLHLSDIAEGSVAGLTVYAVPQVMAAASPFGTAALHTGTLVKLMRVLTLGPVCIVLSLLYPRKNRQTETHQTSRRLIPWYITGFLLMITCRSFNIIPEALLPVLNTLATTLTVMAMAALGMSFDIRSVFKASGPLMLTVALSLAGLVSASLALMKIVT